MRTRLPLLAATLLLPPLPSPTSAQGAATAEVRGVVWDSVAGRPLAAAAVQLVSAGDPAAPVAGRALTDSAGAFAITGILPGLYLAGFLHPALDSLGIEPPLRRVEVTAPITRTTLAIPGNRRLAEALCGAARDSVGGFAGVLRDADGLAPTGGTVVVRWSEIVIGAGGMRERVRRARVPADSATGRFLFCGLPSDAELAVQAERGEDTTGAIPLSVTARAIVHRDLWIAGPRPVGVTLRGSVRAAETGQPIRSAQVRVLGGEARAAVDSSGHWQIGAAPAGTRTIEVRALGFAPERRVVHLVRGREVREDVTLTSLETILDTVKVTERFTVRDYDNGFARRRRGSGGHFFSTEEIEKLQPAQLSDLLRRIPSVRVEERVGEMGIRMRGEPIGCPPVVFIDGVRAIGLDLRDLNSFVRPGDIGLMEVYEKELAPPEFSTFDECGGVIVVWTRRPLMRAIPRPRARTP